MQIPISNGSCIGQVEKSSFGAFRLISDFCEIE